MTEKEKQAKLQYLLNSLSMTKEQKDIVVDLVNSSGNGGGGTNVKNIYVKQDPNNINQDFCLSIDDINTTYASPDNINNVMHVRSTEFVNKIYEYIDKNCIFNLILDDTIITPITLFINKSEYATPISISIGDMSFQINKDYNSEQ